MLRIVIVALGIAGIFVVVAISRPSKAIYIWIIVSAVLVVPLSSRGVLARFPLPSALLMLLILGWLLRSLVLKNIWFGDRWLRRPLQGLIVVAVISMIGAQIYRGEVPYRFLRYGSVSLNFLQASEIAVLVVYALTPIVVFSSIKSHRELRWVWWVFIIMAGVMHSIGKFYSTIFSGSGGMPMLWGLSRTRIPFLGISAVAPLFLITGQLLKGRVTHWQRRLLYFLFAVFSVAVFLSLFRAIWMATLAGLLLMMYVSSKKRFLLVLLLIVFILLPPFGLVQRVVPFLFPPEKIDRLYMAKDALRIWTMHPIFGVGAGCYQSYSLEYGTLPGRGMTGSPHNQYLFTLAETGIFGLVMLIWFLSSAVHQSLDQYRNFGDGFCKGLSLGVYGFFVYGIVTGFSVESIMVSSALGGGIERISFPVFWVFLGLLMRIRRLNSECPQLNAKSSDEFDNPLYSSESEKFSQSG